MRVSDRRFTVGFADPMARLAAFHAEWIAERSHYVTEIRTAHREAREAAALTRARLLAVAAALAHNLDTLESLVRPILGDAPHLDGTAESRLAGAPEHPIHSRGRLLYLFRDWVWGSSETVAIDDLELVACFSDRSNVWNYQDHMHGEPGRTPLEHTSTTGRAHACCVCRAARADHAFG